MRDPQTKKMYLNQDPPVFKIPVEEVQRLEISEDSKSEESEQPAGNAPGGETRQNR